MFTKGLFPDIFIFVNIQDNQIAVERLKTLKQLNAKLIRFIWFGAALLLMTGFLAGITTQNYLADQDTFRQISKLNKVLKLVINNYVDTLNSTKLVSSAIEGLLSDLDPHSTYIPPKDLARVNEDFKGKFEGIGIEFRLINDTITVTNPIAGGPSIRLGIQAGDRIIAINDSSAIGLEQGNIPSKLRGPKGSKVKVKIYRPSVNREMEYVITRDEISLFSIDIHFMLDKETGYIKVNRFSSTTHEEFVRAIRQLQADGMSRLILDLRGNPGGFLDQAVKMADELLDGNKKIVYTKSRNPQAEETYSAQDPGHFEDGDLVLLLDRSSASASEIVAGAIQDWDRGLIVGETSFGKGLVQRQYNLEEDNSAVRLTVSRYYTPSGRLIQRPYDHGREEYYEEVRNRKSGLNGLSGQDSSENHLTKYFTAGKRPVSGGGGITPDYQVSEDTLHSFTAEIIRKGIIPDFIMHYMDSNREKLKKDFRSMDYFINKYTVSPDLYSELVATAAREGVKPDSTLSDSDVAWIRNHMKALVARQLWGDTGYYKVNVRTDKVLNYAWSVLGEVQVLSRSILQED